MGLIVKSFTGERANEYKGELAKLRIQIFREFPYLYEGTIEYEEKYLETFTQSSESIIVVAFKDDKVIGVSTGIPLKYEPIEVKKPWIEGGYKIDKIYYFSESVLMKEYRGQGMGVKFFKEREQWAKQLNYKIAIFCGVIRADNHPDRPTDFIPLDKFWEKRGFKKKEGFKCKMSWKEINEQEGSEKELQFWYKTLM